MYFVLISSERLSALSGHTVLLSLDINIKQENCNMMQMQCFVFVYLPFHRSLWRVFIGLFTPKKVMFEDWKKIHVDSCANYWILYHTILYYNSIIILRLQSCCIMLNFMKLCLYYLHPLAAEPGALLFTRWQPLNWTTRTKQRHELMCVCVSVCVPTYTPHVSVCVCVTAQHSPVAGLSVKLCINELKLR